MRKHLFFATLLAGSMAAGYGTAALADLKHTQEVRSGDDPKAAPMQRITNYIGANGRRVETSMNMGPAQMNSIALTICDKRQEIKLDPGLKIYTVTPIDQKGDATAADDEQTGNNAPKPGEATGKIINTSTVQDLGEEIVADVQTRHYMVTQRIQSSGCAGDSDTTMKMEIWVAPGLKEPNMCPAISDAQTMYNEPSQSDCKITFEQKGDTAALAKVYDGLRMRTKMYMNDKVVTVSEVTSLSRAKLDEALFTVPADFKQVSDEEYQKAQSAAMMQAMMQSMQAGNNGDDNAEEDEAADEEAAPEKKNEEQPAEEKPRDKLRLPFKLPRF